MRVFLKRIIFFCGPIIIYFITLILIDNTGYLNSSKLEIAAKKQKTSNLEFFDPNFNDRALLLERLKLLKHTTIPKAVIGNSRGFLIGSSSNMKGFVNFSLSGATIKDYKEVQFYLKKFDIKIDTCYVIIDPTHFLPEDNNTYQSIDSSLISRQEYVLKKLLDIKYHNDIVKSFFRDKMFKEIKNPVSDNQIRFIDGSLKYHKSFASLSDKAKKKRFLSVEPLKTDFKQENINLLLSFLKDFKYPIIIKSPYNPVSYKIINRNGAIDSTNVLLKKYFKKYKMIGDYDPYKIGFLSDSSYYDGRHPKASVLKYIINNKI